MNTKFLYIPSWIIDSIKASKGSVNQILDFSKVESILSNNDLAEFAFFSENASRLLGIEPQIVVETGARSSNAFIPTPQSPTIESILSLWNTFSKGAQPNRSDVEKIRTHIAINDCERSLNERLFTDQSPVSASVKAFDILHFDLGVIGVVIYPGAFTPGLADENRFLLVRALVKELTTLNPQEVVANTLLMRRYIELLGVR